MGKEERSFHTSHIKEMLSQGEGFTRPIFDVGANPQPIENRRLMILSQDGILRQASPAIVQKKILVEWGWETGCINTELTEIQSNVLKTRYPKGKNLVIGFGELRARLRVDVARRTLYKWEQAGLQILEDARGENNLRREVRYLYEVENFPILQIAKHLRMSTNTVAELMKISNTQSKNVGRQPKSMKINDPGLVRLVIEHLRVQGKSYKEIGDMVGLTKDGVARRIRQWNRD